MSNSEPNQQDSRSANSLSLSQWFSKHWLLLSVVLLLVILAINSILWVPEGQAGIRSRFGKISPKALESGLHGKLPFADKVQFVSTRLLYSEVKTDALTSDGLVANISLAQQYQLNPSGIPQLWQKIGSDKAVAKIILVPAIRSSAQNIIGQYQQSQLSAQQAKIENQILTAVQAQVKTSLKGDDLDNAITLKNLLITKISFPKEAASKAVEADAIKSDKTADKKESTTSK